MSLRKIVLILIIVISATNCFSQGGSVRIAVYGGSNINFVFNTMNAYKNGIIYSNYTTIGLDVIDDPALPDYTKWELSLSVQDADGDGKLTGSSSSNTIPFDVIEVRASILSGCPTCKIINPINAVPLKKVPTVLIDGSALGGPDNIPPDLHTASDQIQLTYECGVNVKLWSLSPSPAADYYSDDIFIDLIMSP